MTQRPTFAISPALVAGLAIALGAATAAAQDHTVIRPAPKPVITGGMPSLDAPPPLSHDRLVRYATVLGLDADQMKAAEALYDTYTKSVQKVQKKMRDELRRAQEDAQDGDPSALQTKLPEVAGAAGKQSAAARDQFLADLKSLLRPEQAGNWDKLDQLRRRDTWLARGTLTGSNVDLISIVDALKLPPAQRSPLASTLDLYGVDLDRPLREREQFLSAPGDDKGSRSFDTDSMNVIKKHIEDQRVIDAKVRDVNQRYARQLAELVPDDKRGVFDDLVKQQAFKRVYKDSAAARRAAAAQNLGDLTQAQQDAIAKALANYNQKIQAANDRWASAIDKAEQNGQTPLAPLAAMASEEPANPDLADARKGRRDLDSGLRSELEKVLSPEQMAQVQAAAAPTDTAGQRIAVTAIAGGPGTPMVVMGQDDMDDEDMAGLGGMLGGTGGMVIMKHEVTSTGDGQDQHHVTITTTPAPTTPPKK